MLKSILRVMTITLVIGLLLFVFSSCDKMVDQGATGPRVEDGTGIVSITKTASDGLIDTYTIVFNDGTTTTFVVTNGEQGVQGIQGEKGTDGHTPVITIQNGYWHIDGVNTNHSAVGIKGQNGLDGVGVVNAYVDQNLHLWIVLSDGTEIDAGYVGVTPEDPEIKPEITDPTILVSSANASAGDTDVEITVALKNNPGVTSILTNIAFDDNALDLVSMTYNTEIGGTGIPLQSTVSPVKAYWADGFNNVTGDWVFVTLKFNVSNSATCGDYGITLTYDADDVFNAEEINVDFEIVNGKITVSQM